MAANFPDTPALNDTTIIDGIKYNWNGDEWIIVTGAIRNTVVQSDNGTVDLSKGSYHKILIDPDNLTVPVEFSNIPSESSKWTLEFEMQTPADISYDIENASYDNVIFSVASQDANSQGIFFKPDGTKIYMIGFDSDNVHQYTLSTAWDLNTASYDSVSFSVTGQDTGPRSIFFKSDGTKMYMIGSISDSAHQYTLSTPWDVSTASYDSVSFSVAGQDTSPQGIFFKSDGTKMYIIGVINDTVYQYTLSTAWDLSTASYDSVSFSVAGQETGPFGVSFKTDGTKLYIIGAVNDTVYQYTLSTAWDISTASYDSVSFSVAGQDEAPLDIKFKSDGTKMYMLGGANDIIYQYSIGDIYNPSVSWPNSIIWDGNTAPAILKNQNLILEFYTPDGGTTIYGIEAINKDNT